MEQNNEPSEANETIEVEATPEVKAPEASKKVEPATETAIEFDFDKRLYTDDGKFNQEGAKEYVTEIADREKHLEERLLGMRRIVSRNGEVVEKAEAYFQDFAPPPRFEKFFNEETPKETKEYLHGMTNNLSKKYLDIGLNQQQALEVSNSILEIMEQVGVLDTRTDQQRYIDDQKFITSQKASLGANAETIIREAEVFILNANEFDAKQKNKMIDMIKAGDMGLVSVMHSIKDAFGKNTGGVPSNITNLGGLKPDSELRDEYKTAGDARRSEIISQRHKAGRKGKLFDSFE